MIDRMVRGQNDSSGRFEMQQRNRSRVRIEFLSSPGPVLSCLEVESEGCEVACDLRQALHALRVQIVCMVIRGGRLGAVHDLRIVEFDGAPLSPKRRADIVAELGKRLTSAHDAQGRVLVA